MVRLGFTIYFGLFFSAAFAQQLAANRITAWQNAGTTQVLESPLNQVNITDFGADNTGSFSSEEAYELAKASLQGQPGTIVFPAGQYLFEHTLVVPSGVFLKGESSDTKFIFNLNGTGNSIQLVGSINSAQYAFSSSALKGSTTLTLQNASDLQPGDVLKIGMFDEDYMTSTWAYGTLGQIVEVVAVNGNTILLSDPLNHHYPIGRAPYALKVDPVRNAGVECLSILREDQTSGSHTSNIYIQNAFNCVVRNVTSEDSNFGHVDIRTSAHVTVEGGYFHHAQAYGGGGQGYGVVVESTSSYCLVQNNIFEHLRHSMLLQSGANGNVFSYNYSFDPYWEDGFLPANSAGDAVLHGNYVFMNLFEGNTVQHIVVDASHGINGPFNTFFRNRAELYGFFSDMSTTTDSMNVIGNEITGAGFPYGNFMLNGVGHYSFGNNHSGAETPIGTTNVTLNSLYLEESELPEYLVQHTLPIIGYPLNMDEKTLPSELRFQNQEFVNCGAQVVTAAQGEEKEQSDLQYRDGRLVIHSSLLPASVQVYATDGRLIESFNTSSQVKLVESRTTGIMIFRITSQTGNVATLKALIQD